MNLQRTENGERGGSGGGMRENGGGSDGGDNRDKIQRDQGPEE